MPTHAKTKTIARDAKSIKRKITLTEYVVMYTVHFRICDGKCLFCVATYITTIRENSLKTGVPE